MHSIRPATIRLESSSRLLNALGQSIDDLINMLLLSNERRRQSDERASGTKEHALLEAAVKDVQRASVGHRSGGSDLDCTHQTDVADVDDVGQTLQRVQSLLEVGSQLVGALEDVLLLEHLQSSNTRSHSQRMTTNNKTTLIMIENNYVNALPVSVAVEELDLGTRGLMSGLLDGVEDLALTDDSTAGHSRDRKSTRLNSSH